MKVNKIVLKNFRNFVEKRFVFDDKINVVFGKNAVGKTSLLESIYYCGSTKSPRVHDIDYLIRKNESFFSLDCLFFSKKSNNNLFLSFSNGEKKIILNKQIVKKISEYIGELGIVYYQPNEIVDFLGSPSGRRKTVDLIFSQFSKKYIGALKLYTRVLKERNMALKSAENLNLRQNIILIEMLTESLISAMIPLIDLRKQFCEEINYCLTEIHHKFNSEEKLKLKYRPNMEICDIFENVKKLVNVDIQNKNTNFGAHKDDFEFYINGKELTKYCSQGQQKSAILSFKLAAAEVFNKIKGEYPVLLLDDALSELDKERQNALFGLIKPEMQLFLSTTSLKEIDDKILKKAKIIEIEKGEDFDE